MILLVCFLFLSLGSGGKREEGKGEYRGDGDWGIRGIEDVPLAGKKS